MGKLELSSTSLEGLKNQENRENNLRMHSSYRLIILSEPFCKLCYFFRISNNINHFGFGYATNH